MVWDFIKIGMHLYCCHSCPSLSLPSTCPAALLFRMLWYFTDVTKPGRKCCCSRYFLRMLFLPDALPDLLLCCFPFQTKILVLCLLITGQSHLNLTLLKLKSKQTNLKVLQQCAHLGLFNTVLWQITFPLIWFAAALPTLWMPLLSLCVRLSPWLKLSALPDKDLAFLFVPTQLCKPALLQMQCHEPAACKTALNKICQNFCRLHLPFYTTFQRS